MHCMDQMILMPSGTDIQSEFVHYISSFLQHRLQYARKLHFEFCCVSKALGCWEPSIQLEQGLAVTFEWIAAQVLSKVRMSLVVSAAAD